MGKEMGLHEVLHGWRMIGREDPFILRYDGDMSKRYEFTMNECMLCWFDERAKERKIA